MVPIDGEARVAHVCGAMRLRRFPFFCTVLVRTNALDVKVSQQSDYYVVQSNIYTIFRLKRLFLWESVCLNIRKLYKIEFVGTFVFCSQA